MDSVGTVLQNHLKEIDEFVENLHKNPPTTQDERDEFETFMLDAHEDRNNTHEAIDALNEYIIVRKINTPIVVMSGIRGKSNAELFTQYLNNESAIYEYEYRPQI